MPTNLQSLTEQLYEKNLELLHERRRMEKLLYSVSEAIIVIDKDFKISVFNNVAEVITNKDSIQAIGQDIDAIVNLKNQDSEKFLIKEHCFSEELVSFSRLILKNENQEYYVNFKSFTVISDSLEKECLITLTDVTREKQLEQLKDDFLSVASHELRTPMTIIKSYLWMLGSGKAGTLTDKQQEYLHKSVVSTQRMIDLINDMLSVSRMEQGRVEFNIKRFDLTDLVNDTLAEMLIKAEEKGIYLKINDSETDRFVYADQNKVTEILVNLVGNSLKFTKHGGISVILEEIGDYVKTSVVDTGAGINQDDQLRLFHKFGRLDNSYQTVAESGGTGLGLYIVKLYIEGMGGEVGATSEGINKGSTFWFTLPKNNIKTG